MQASATEHIKAGSSEANGGIYVGRFGPMHKGHQALIKGLIETFGENHLILIGSCNKPLSIRHMFTYTERAAFIRSVFPQARIAPLPDFENDDALWFSALDDLMRLANINPDDAAYIGGSSEDVEFYKVYNRNTLIVNRFSGVTAKISASEVRDALIGQRSVNEFLHVNVAELVHACFPKRWATLCSK